MILAIKALSFLSSLYSISKKYLTQSGSKRALLIMGLFSSGLFEEILINLSSLTQFPFQKTLFSGNFISTELVLEIELPPGSRTIAESFQIAFKDIEAD